MITALLAAALLAAPPDPPPGVEYQPVDPGRGGKDQGEAETSGDALKADPYADQPIDEDDGTLDPPTSHLPEHGQALWPTMPTLDRDMVSPRSHPAGRSAASVGITSIGEDDFLELNLGTVVPAGRWRIAPRLSLRLRVSDAAPHTGYIIRREDWDEPSDFARLLAFVEYGAPGESAFFRYGELNGVTIGHGSLVNRYFNTIDIDHYKGGVYASGDLGIFGAEGLLDDVFDPAVLIGRAFVRPLHLDPDLPLALRELKLAVTVGGDFTAPTRLAESDGRIFATPDWEPDVVSQRPIGLFGTDLEVPLVSTPHIDVVPYADLATLGFDSIGAHLGTYFNARFDPRTSLRVRLEYRRVGAGHDPGYVGPFYAIERFSYLDGEPKLAALDDLPTFAHAYSGFQLETHLRVADLFAWSLMLTTADRHPAYDLLTRVRFPSLGPLSLTFLLARIGFDDFADIFDDEKTIVGLSARVRIFSYFFVRGSVVRQWWLGRDADGASSYGTVLDWDLGVGLVLKP